MIFVGLACTLGWTDVRVLGWIVLGIMTRRDYSDAVELGEVTVERSCISEIKPSHEPEKPDSADTTIHEVEQHDADVPALKDVVGGP
ncbi:MAG: hypothetical protein CMO26_11080 [Thiotrichales bacterium]|nr:hypothetical protein [Thiotrichales bacterium]